MITRDGDAERLLPCPFCGSEDIDPTGWLAVDRRSGPACNKCAATAYSPSLWNKRFSSGAALREAQAEIARLRAPETRAIRQMVSYLERTYAEVSSGDGQDIIRGAHMSALMGIIDHFRASPLWAYPSQEQTEITAKNIEIESHKAEVSWRIRLMGEIVSAEKLSDAHDEITRLRAVAEAALTLAKEAKFVAGMLPNAKDLSQKTDDVFKALAALNSPPREGR